MCVPVLARCGARARAHVNVHMHGLLYTHAANVHVYVCVRVFTPNGKNEWNKCKNHFNEMKGDVGMSPHEKEGNKKNLHQADNPFLHLCS